MPSQSKQFEIVQEDDLGSGDFGVLLQYDNKGQYIKVTPNRNLSKSTFIVACKTIFNIDKVFDQCTVVTRLTKKGAPFIIHSGGDMVTFCDALLKARRLTVTLIPAEKIETNVQLENEVKDPFMQDEWKNLKESLRRIEANLEGKIKNFEVPFSEVVHEGVLCDGCQINDANRIINTDTTDCNGFIRGPRFTCLYCHDYDLCYKCESSGFTSDTHKVYHNMIRSNSYDPKLTRFVLAYHRAGEMDINFPLVSKYNVSDTPPKKELSEIKVEGFYGTNDGTSEKPTVSESDPSSESSAPADATTNTDQEFKDVIIEVGQHNKPMFDFFSKIQSEEELSSLMQDAVSWRIAKQWYGEDIYEKLEKYETMMKEKVQQEQADSDAVIDKDSLGNDQKNRSLRVEMSQKGHLLTFKLFNDGDETIPNGLKLVFQCEQRDRVSTPIKCNLQMGPNELQPGNYKILNFNYRGTLEEFSFDCPCKIDLIDVRDQIVYTSDECASPGSSVFYLKPPTCEMYRRASYRDVPCNEEYEGRDGQYEEPNAFHSDTDVISTSFTEQEDNGEEAVFVDSLSEDYDLLSDSDIEQV